MIVAIAVVTVAVKYAAQLLLRQALKASARTTTAWDDALLKVGGLIARHGAEIAFPTQTLHLQGETPVDA